MTLYPEPLVARVTNVNRATLASTRRALLEKGDDWTLDNSVTCYTAPGLKKLLEALGLADAPLAWPDADNATRDPAATPPSATPDQKKSPIALAPAAVAARVAAAGAVSAARAVVDLVVVSLSRNPSIVHAVRAGDEKREPVLVRVRTNANFIAGMKLKARAPAPGSTLYYFEGQCPRWKGRY